VLEQVEARAVNAVNADAKLLAQLKDEGLRWGQLQYFIFEKAQLQAMDRGFEDVAYNMVRRVLDKVCGPRNQGWHSFRQDGKTWVKRGPRPS
jgi:hypothetical protein